MTAHVKIRPFLGLWLALVGLVMVGGAGRSADARAEAPALRPAADSLAALPDSAAADSMSVVPRLVVYYFHTTQRCASCRKLEAYAKEAVDTGFPAELKAGRVVWRVVNVEEAGNEHFVKDYQLYTKSLVLVEEGEDGQTRWKNLEKVWALLNDKKGYLAYVQAETRAYLPKAR